MPLCEICKDVLQGRVWGRGARGNTESHHCSFDSLLKSVDEKCFICLRAFRTFDGHVQGWLSKVASGIANESSATAPDRKIPLTESSQPPVAKPRPRAVTSIKLFVEVAIPTVNFQVFPLVLKESLSSLRETCGKTWSSETQSRVQALEAQLTAYNQAQNPDDHMFYLNGVIPLSMTGESAKRIPLVFYPKANPLRYSDRKHHHLRFYHITRDLLQNQQIPFKV